MHKHNRPAGMVGFLKAALVAIALTAAWVVVARAEDGGTLEVTVDNVRKPSGSVRIAVCTQDTFLKPDCPFHGSAPARTGSVVVRVTGLPPGTYAVQAYQDEDDSRRIKRSLLGIPEEGFGFSRDAPTSLGSPSFSSAAFQMSPGAVRIGLHLRYFD